MREPTRSEMVKPLCCSSCRVPWAATAAPRPRFEAAHNLFQVLSGLNSVML